MFDFEFHFHKWVFDTQGAIYCIRCRKFKGWKAPELREWTDKDAMGSVVHYRQGWGYELNGEEWKHKIEAEIRLRGGFYD